MRVARLHAAGARHAFLLRERVAGERHREGAPRRTPAEARGQVAQVEGVVAAPLETVVGRIGRGAQVVQEGEVARAAQVVREGEVIEVARAGAARQVHLARGEGAVGDAPAGERRIAGPAGDDIHHAARAGLREGERRRAAVDLDVVDGVERQVGQVDGLVAGAAERDAVQVDLHLSGRGAADRDRAEVAEPPEAAHLHADRVGERLGERLHPAGRRSGVHHGRERGRIARPGGLGRGRRRDHDLAQLLAALVGRPRAGHRRREGQDEERCGSVRRRTSLPARRDEGGGEAHAPHPAPSPRKDLLLASAGQVFWLGDHPHPVPSRPEGQWLRPGSSPLTAAGQRGLRTPFPHPTDVCWRSSAPARAVSRRAQGQLGIAAC